MKKVQCFFFSLALLFAVFKAAGQVPNPLDLNTAVNAAHTGTLSKGTPDLHWRASLTSSVGPFVSAVSCDQAYSSWYASTAPNVNWISYPHTCVSNDPAEHSCLNPADQNVFYTATLSLPANVCGKSVATPSAYCVGLDMYADNSVYQIFVNGQSAYLNTTSNPYYFMGYIPGNKVSVALCNFWQAGVNTIVVHVKSGAGVAPTWEAFLAEVNQTLVPSSTYYMAAASTNSNVKCFGGANGSATINVTSGVAPYSYSWSPSVSTSSTASNLSAGNYTVQVQASNSCVATQTFTITQPPATTLSVSGNTVAQCAGKTITLNVAGAATYTWNPGNLTGNTVTLTPMSTTVYTITSSDLNGCSASRNYTQVVTNCQGINESEIFEQVRHYPNPVKDFVTLTNLPAGCFVQLYDALGQLLASESESGAKVLFDLSHTGSGVYFVKISAGNSTYTRRIIKE
jgi:hypothetical protein